ncbi:hypothetical protein [Macrococcoides canis]|uniref:hypothetical protein n=1 Tax=Macrococcoides canis TaxID=1855823 RepID=UPI00165DBF9C|nr:hypothetical protein [Macrococcus canis]QNR08584.1 hypothetical protein GL258_10170 [Macrococcus canis]
MNYKLLDTTILATSVLLGACGGEQATKENKSETTAKKIKKEQSKKEENTGLKDNAAVLNDIEVKVLEIDI